MNIIHVNKYNEDSILVIISMLENFLDIIYYLQINFMI